MANLAELAPPTRAVPPLEIRLPDGDRLVVPFTSHFKSEPVDCSSSELKLDMTMMFDVDDALREFAEKAGPAPEADGRIQIGYVYATVRFESFLHPGYASVECWAATSGMSRLFARSTNIRKVFTDLTAASGGVCCLFDTGDGGPEQVCWLNGESTQEMVPGPRFPDRRALVATWFDPERQAPVALAQAQAPAVGTPGDRARRRGGGAVDEGGLAAGKSTAAVSAAWIVFAYAAGQSMTLPCARTGGRIGRTPVVRVRSGAPEGMSMAGMVCYKPGGPVPADLRSGRQQDAS
ncbi:hypothetical protein OG604_01480 [Streptomyces sp. NBC_01231]|nr:hypothetical protein OG604_01480 [Streptomyces sp. NBC_01231]